MKIEIIKGKLESIKLCSNLKQTKLDLQKGNSGVF